MTRKRYTFVLNFGYAKHARISYMPWVSSNTYNNAKEALLDLAVFLKDQHFVDNEIKPDKCCLAAKAKDAAAKFCLMCGASLTEKKFDPEYFCDWLCNLDTDVDAFCGMIAYNPDNRWQAGVLEGSPNQRVVYQAEWVLSAALGHPYNNQKTFDAICKKRTKNRRDIFCCF